VRSASICTQFTCCVTGTREQIPTLRYNMRCYSCNRAATVTGTREQILTLRCNMHIPAKEQAAAHATAATELQQSCNSSYYICIYPQRAGGGACGRRSASICTQFTCCVTGPGVQILTLRYNMYIICVYPQRADGGACGHRSTCTLPPLYIYIYIYIYSVSICTFVPVKQEKCGRRSTCTRPPLCI